MPITLTTGLPGSAKTLSTIHRVENLRRKTGRPVYYSGIKDLNLPWIEHDPLKWYELPPEAIMVIDEAQRIFRPRGNGAKVEPHEEQLETHRHLGIDLELLTQHPRLVSVSVRSLADRHLHVVRKFGMQWSTIHEWREVRMNVDNRKDSIKHDFKFPKEVFGWYKSAEVHTIKRAIPTRVYMFFVLLVLAPLLGWWGFRTAFGIGGVKDEPQQHQVVPGQPYVGTPPAGERRRVMSPGEYADQFRPRVAGLAYTAPVYDEVTRPSEAPFPAACIQSAKRCQCYSQQGTRLDVPRDLCKSISEGGFFVAWRQDGARVQGAAMQASSALASGAPAAAPTAVSLGGSPRGHVVEAK